MKLFLMQALSYFLIVANTRAFTQGWYGWTAATDFLFAAVNFTLFKQITQADGKYDWFWYALGGTMGSLLAIAITKFLYGA